MWQRWTIGLWWRLAGCFYSAGEWAMQHVPDCIPDDACRERIRARTAHGLRHGLLVAPLTDEDMVTGAADIVRHWVGINARFGMHGMALAIDDDEGDA